MLDAYALAECRRALAQAGQPDWTIQSVSQFTTAPTTEAVILDQNQNERIYIRRATEQQTKTWYTIVIHNPKQRELRHLTGQSSHPAQAVNYGLRVLKIEQSLKNRD